MKLLLICLVSFSFLTSCKKNKENEEVGNIVFKLTDTPGEFEHLYLDIQEVQINHSEKGWIKIVGALNGLVDILAFKNGHDTLLTNATLPTGTYYQLRLILGANNTLVKNGVSYPLTIPSASQSGVKVSISEALGSNENKIRWIDFDAGKSVKLLPNGTYQLKPTIRSFNQSENGILDGHVMPMSAKPYVQLTKGQDTLLAIPNPDGYFKFLGLNGNYNAQFIPTDNAFTSVTINGIVLTPGTIFNVGIITLP